MRGLHNNSIFSSLGLQLLELSYDLRRSDHAFDEFPRIGLRIDHRNGRVSWNRKGDGPRICHWRGSQHLSREVGHKKPREEKGCWHTNFANVILDICLGIEMRNFIQYAPAELVYVQERTPYQVLHSFCLAHICHGFSLSHFDFCIHFLLEIGHGEDSIGALDGRRERGFVIKISLYCTQRGESHSRWFGCISSDSSNFVESSSLWVLEERSDD